jgi:hypothetical protein
MSITLNQEELHELTGYEVPAWQIKWLKERGWVFEVSRKRPKVSRAYFEQRMGLQAIVQPEPELDFSCWRKQA